MNKKIKNLFLAGALVLGFAGVAVSCTDYDDDINKLQQQIAQQESTISSLTSQVGTLQGAIDAGAVIKTVTAISGEPGGWKFTLSDGSTYEISNGAKGADGKNGTNGTNGKDGKWYTPNAETGCWDVHEMVNGEEKVTDTKQSYLPKGQTNVKYDAANNTLVITDGEKTETVKLDGTGEKSLVFIPQVYVDGVEGFQATSLEFKPLTGAALDSKEEKWTAAEEVVRFSPAVFVEYHVNASNVKLDETFNYEFIVKKNVPFVVTRGDASADFNVIPTFKSYKDGILTLAVEVVGKEASAEKISVVALKATKDSVSVVSDYATLFTGEIKDLRIADPVAVSTTCKNVADEHYRRGEIGISKADEEDKYIPKKEAWIEGYAETEDVHATCDTVVAYDGTLDLKTITAIHYKLNPDDTTCVEMSAEDAEKYGLKFEYEVVKNYRIGKPVTDQAEFVITPIADGIFTPKVFTLDGTVAAVGRTPIVRVKLIAEGKVVQVAYIKVYIAETATIHAKFDMVPKRDAKDDGENIFRFRCDGDTLITTVKDMNEILYTGVSMSKYNFHKVYDSLKVAPAEDNVGAVYDSIVPESEGTHVIVWTMTAEDLWAAATEGKNVQILARYYDSKKPDVNYVDIKLTATVDKFGKVLNLVSTGENPDYDLNYWYKDVRGNKYNKATRFNVNVPAVGDTDPTHAQFENDINTSFVTYGPSSANAGKIKVENVDSVAYYFCKEDVAAITKIGDLNVKFTVSGENLDSLYASIVDAAGTKVVGDSLVAWISNTDTTKGSKTIWNMFHYVKGNTVADTLLNTNGMYTYIAGNAYLCTANGDTDKVLAMNFDGANCFEADILQPVFVAENAAKDFKDGVDFGREGSYIKVEDLLDPYDWRNVDYNKHPEYNFNYKKDNKLQNEYYWDYYGPFEVVIDIANAECDLDGKWGPVKSNIILTQTEKGVTAVPDPVSGVTVNLPANKSGYLTYKNNSNNVQTFNLRVKAKVKYGFGYIDSKWIQIKVNGTEGQPTE